MQPKSYSIEECYQLVKEQYPQYNDDTIIIPKWRKRQAIIFKNLIITLLITNDIYKTSDILLINDKTLRKYLKTIFPELYKLKTTWKTKLLLQVNLKQCCKCERIYSINNFDKDITNTSNYHSICKLCKKYYNKNYRTNNPEYQHNYYKNNKEKFIKYNSIAKKRLKERTPKWLTEQELQTIQEFYNNCPEGYHVDHIIPLNGKNVSGFHCLANLQYLPASKNLSKNNKYIPKIEYL